MKELFEFLHIPHEHLLCIYKLEIQSNGHVYMSRKYLHMKVSLIFGDCASESIIHGTYVIFLSPDERSIEAVGVVTQIYIECNNNLRFNNFISNKIKNLSATHVHLLD